MLYADRIQGLIEINILQVLLSTGSGRGERVEIYNKDLRRQFALACYCWSCIHHGKTTPVLKENLQKKGDGS